MSMALVGIRLRLLRKGGSPLPTNLLATCPTRAIKSREVKHDNGHN
ncbi:hypothetical protein ACFLVS_05370 [Chloroflexota bacterium]